MMRAFFAGDPTLDRTCLQLFEVRVTAFRKQITSQHVLLHALDLVGDAGACASTCEVSHEYLMISAIAESGEVAQVFGGALPIDLVRC